MLMELQPNCRGMFGTGEIYCNFHTHSHGEVGWMAPCQTMDDTSLASHAIFEEGRLVRLG